MLNKVRREMSRLAPQRFDGISSIDYIGPRIIEHGPNGPTVTDVTELLYSPKEVIICESASSSRPSSLLKPFQTTGTFAATTESSLSISFFSRSFSP